MSLMVKAYAAVLVAAKKAVGAAFCGVVAAVFLAPVSMLAVNYAAAQGQTCNQQNREGGANTTGCGDCLSGKTEVFRFYRVTDTDRGCRMHFCPERSFPLGAVTALRLKKDDLFICRENALTDKIGVTLARRHELRVI